MAPATQERQIKPIYEAIDSGQYKAALQACVKLLKKQPKNDLIKALKALSLIRMNKVDEGSTLCDEVLATQPTDDLVLGAMSLVLKHLSRHDDLAAMFSVAYKQFPQNDEFGAQAFMAYVRLGHWRLAQQVATKMNKSSKDERFLYWNIMCIILQANEPATTPETQPILYKLALRLVSTCPVPSTISPERFYLHLCLLRDIGDYDEALRLLDTDLGRSLCETNLDLEDLRYTIAITAGRKEEEYNLAKVRLIEKRDRNYLTFLKFINSALARMDEPDILPETRTTLSYLAEIDGSTERGSLLARLELESRIRFDFPDASKPDFVDILRRHFETFKGKPSCFEDLKKFSVLMEKEERGRWRAFLDEQDVSGVPSTVTQLNHQINTYKLQRWDIEAEDISVDLEETLSRKYLKAYISALPLGRDLPKTELQPADDLALLSASSLVSLHLLTKSRAYLSSAVTLLEYAIIRSPQSFQARLLLIRLYRLLGAPSLALDHYRKLGVKQVQNDTMVHFIMGRVAMFNLGAIGDLTYLQECLESTNIYTANTSETPDMVIKAFQYEKYSQIPEFIEFEDRLDSSIQRDLTKMEYVRMRLTHEPITVELIDTELVELKFLYERSHTQFDNRDFSVLPDLQPHGQSIDIQTSTGGNSPGSGWLHTWMRMYTLVFQLASDLDPSIDGHILLGDKFHQITPPGQGPLNQRIREFSETEASELTDDEKRMREFAMSLMLWLEPHHDYSRLSPPKPLLESPAAAALQTLTASTVTAPPNSKLSGGTSPAGGSSASSPPPLVELPTEVSIFFEGMENSFKRAVGNELPWKSMHVATLTQEAFLILNIVTARFRLGGGSKVKKGDPLVNTLKSLREKAISALKTMATQLIKDGEAEATVEGRRIFVKETKLIQCVPQIHHDFCLDIAKNVTDARKKVREGLGRGIERLCKAQTQGLTMSS